MAAKVEIYDALADPDADPIAWSCLGHVPRRGDLIRLNAMDTSRKLEVLRVEWFIDDGRVEEVPQVCIYVKDAK